MGRKFRNSDPILKSTLSGLSLEAPIGLSAGYDKSAHAINFIGNLGFGLVEVGSVTVRPWGGNKGCRALRLENDKDIWSRYGLPNDGADTVLNRFKAYKGTVPLGISVAAVHEDRPEFNADMAIAEICETLEKFEGHADYAVVNISCPNCEGHELFSDIEKAKDLLAAVARIAPSDTPLFVKFGHRNDDTWNEEFYASLSAYPVFSGIIPIAIVMGEQQVKGDHLRGSVTGHSLFPMTIDIVRQWAVRIDPQRHALFASGGISNPFEAYQAIRAGASFVQIFSALIYEGPGLVRYINSGLADLLRQDGFDSLSEAVGADLERDGFSMRANKIAVSAIS